MIGLTYIGFAAYAHTFIIRYVYPGYAGLYLLFAVIYYLYERTLYNKVHLSVASISGVSLIITIVMSDVPLGELLFYNRSLHLGLAFILIGMGIAMIYKAILPYMKDITHKKEDFPNNLDVYEQKDTKKRYRKYF